MGQMDRVEVARKAIEALNRLDDHAKVLESHGTGQTRHSAAIKEAGDQIAALRMEISDLRSRIDDLEAGARGSTRDHNRLLSVVDRATTFAGAAKVLVGLGRRLW